MKFKKQFWFPLFHHYYIGWFLLIVAFILLGYSFVTMSLIVFMIGLLVLIDDYVQHFIQTTRDPKYHSPLHRLYGMIYKYRIIQWLNRLADKLFGARKDGKGK